MDNPQQPLDDFDRKMRSVRNTVVITGIFSSMFTILGVSLCNAYLFSNVRATLEFREDSAALMREAKKTVEETDALLKKLQEKYDKQAAHD